MVLVELQGAKGIPASEMLWFNSISSLPILILFTWVTGEGAAMGNVYTAAVAKQGVAVTMTAITLCSTGAMMLTSTLIPHTSLRLCCASQVSVLSGPTVPYL